MVKLRDCKVLQVPNQSVDSNIRRYHIKRTLGLDFPNLDSDSSCNSLIFLDSRRPMKSTPMPTGYSELRSYVYPKSLWPPKRQLIVCRSKMMLK